MIGSAAGASAYELLDDDAAPARRVAAATSTPTPTISATPSAAPVVTPSPTTRPDFPTRAGLRAIARRSAVAGGRVQLALVATDRVEVVAAASSGSTQTPFRMWSVSKAATVIALLRANGWSDQPGRPLREDVERAVHSALVRSGDCAQRQLVVELQERLGGIDAARQAVQTVLRDGGAERARVLDRQSAAGSGCRPFLERTRTKDPYRVALQLGTAEWTIADAARFALALGDGTYPPAITDRLLDLLRRRKLHADDPFANGLDVTSRLDWGAGHALGDLRPAYKSGWGGSSGETPTFVTEQVIHLRTKTGVRYGIAVSYEPRTVPARDDPGLTAAPVALDRALRQVRAALQL